MLLQFLRHFTHRNANRPPSNVATTPETELVSIIPEKLVNTANGLTDARHIIEQYLVRIQERPNDPHILSTLAKLYALTDSFEESLYYYKLLEICSPDSLVAYIGQACLYRDLSQYKNALEACERAEERGLGCAKLYYIHATIFHFSGFLVKARTKYLAAFELTPDDPNILSDYGRLLCELGEFGAAENHLTQALELDQKNQNGWLSLGFLYMHLQRFENAATCYDKGVALNPKSKEALFYRSLFHLLSGNYIEGWKGFESRSFPINFRWKSLNYPLWNGESIQDKTLLIYGEQGLGDETMFSSCIPDALARVPNIVIECNGKLAPMLSRSFPSSTVISRIDLKSPRWTEIENTIDYRIPIGSLPSLFRLTSSDFPQHRGYLKADLARTEHWKSELRKLGGRLNVGISWRGGTQATRRSARSTQLTDWLPIFRNPDCIFINLQYDSHETELTDFASKHNVSAYTFESVIRDYDETAAVITALDLVISVQTAVVHLAGALGKETWVMLSPVPEWRYGLEGNRMAWYPSVSLFRGKNRENWADCVEAIVQKLRTRLTNI